MFAALTGPRLCGKTTVLEAVIADLADRSLRCIRIFDPDKVPAKLAAQIEQVAYAEAGKPENFDRHVVLAVDDAHAASEELLRCLTRLASVRELGRRMPQVLLVGAPELWTRLAAEEYAPLARRLAVRAVLPLAEGDEDPWASVEQEVTQTLAQLRGEGEVLAAAPQPGASPAEASHLAGPGLEPTQARGRPIPEPVRAETGEAAVPPPSMYALFPDPPPRTARAPRGDSRRRVPLLLGVLFVPVAACALVLSVYAWPDLFADLPWAAGKPAASFVLPSSPRDPDTASPQFPASLQDSQPTPSPAMPAPPLAAASPESKPSAPPLAPPAQATAPEAPPPSAAIAEPAPQAAAEPPKQASAAPAAPPTPPAEAGSVRPAVAAAPVSPEIIALLLRRGDEQVAIGDLSAARLLYRRAAEAGSARGARLAGRTYDEAFLPAADVSVLADREAALNWYARAAALGDAQAAKRLKTLKEGR